MSGPIVHLSNDDKRDVMLLAFCETVLVSIANRTSSRAGDTTNCSMLWTRSKMSTQRTLVL